MSREAHVRFWEGAGVRFPCATHLPLERQCRMMSRYGLDVTSQTLWDQLNALADLARPSYDALGKMLRDVPVLHADESGWPMLNGPGRAPWTIWTRSMPEIAHYSILSSKSAKAARRLFSGYEGIVVVDGYTVYEVLARGSPKMRLANCWAHALRKFIAKTTTPWRVNRSSS